MSKPQVLTSDRIVYCDVDDTLVLWDISEYPDEPRVEVKLKDEAAILVPHKYNINTLKKFYKLGYTIIVHSGSGHRWAEEVVKALELQKYVTLIMSKPMYHFDDIPCQEWMGPRIYRDPKTGKAWKSFDIDQWMKDNSKLLDDLGD